MLVGEWRDSKREERKVEKCFPEELFLTTVPWNSKALNQQSNNIDLQVHYLLVTDQPRCESYGRVTCQARRPSGTGFVKASTGDVCKSKYK